MCLSFSVLGDTASITLAQYYAEVFPHTTVKKGVENVGEVGK